MSSLESATTISQLEDVEREALAALAQADDIQSLEAAKLGFLGQKGSLTAILRGLSQIDKEARRHLGQLANLAKDKIQAAYDRQKELIEEKELAAKLATSKIDVTLPGVYPSLGHIHPLTQITNEIVEIFFGMGFSVVSGPEVETEYYNFDALNYTIDHPARDDQDTIYTDVGAAIVLRSQTSSVQARVMEKKPPPLRIISPGRVYRNEEVNARKYPLFHQLEALLVDKDVTFGDLKGTLNEFVRLFFGRPMQTRFRPDFFPFTEPSAELDCRCCFCDGSGCRTCGNRGWLELLGCGMVDPAVLQKAGIDPEIWSGFAWGMGIERIAMLKYNINDIRHFYTNDLRFLEQF